MSDQPPPFLPGEIPTDCRIGIVAARFNGEIVDRLLEGAVGRLGELGVGADRVEIHRVPGAFELPLAAQWLGRTGRFAAIIALGAVIRGETPHFDYVAGECARGIARVSMDLGVPVIFGVLTTNTTEQAVDRLGGSHGHAGRQAAQAALEMVALRRRMGL